MFIILKAGEFWANKYTNRVISLSRFGKITRLVNDNLQVSNSLEREYVKRGKQCLQRMILLRGALKQMVTFGFARSSTCLSFLKAMLETWKNIYINPTNGKRKNIFMWKNYLCKAFGHSIFGFSTWAIMRLIVIAIGGWYAEISGLTLLVKSQYKRENIQPVWFYHEVACAESGKHIGSRNLKLQVYRDILPAWQFELW